MACRVRLHPGTGADLRAEETVMEKSSPPGRVGFIGLGNMGAPMARNLARGGVPLVLMDERAERARELADEIGAQPADRLPELAEASEIVVTMLPNGEVVRGVVLGGGRRPGLIEGLRDGTILVDMGSSDPRVYPEIEAAIGARGAQLVDAPVSGAVTGAKAATLTIMAGGEAGAIDRVEPLFRLLGQRVFRVGALGSGQAMKALNNLASAGALILALEVLLIGQRFGLDPQLMTEILNVSTGRNNSTERKIVPHVLSRRFDSGFALSLMTKDLTTALGLAEITGTPTRLAADTLEIARAALATLGPGADHTELARALEAEVGTELRSGAAAPSRRERA
jgi:3-hydroxyisobutyrate dehydrogenase